MHNFHSDVDAHNTTTPSDDGDHASTQSGHNDPNGDNSHGVIPSSSNSGSGPSRRRSAGHSDGHAGHYKKKLVNLTRFGCCKSICVRFCSIACPKGSSRKFNGLLYA